MGTFTEQARAQGFFSRSIAAVLVATMAGVSHGEVVAVKMFDGNKGATCNYFDSALGLRWQNRGGDWVDARGEKQGESAHAIESVPKMSQPLAVEFDVTELVSKNLKNGRAGFYVSGKGGGIINVASREYGDPAYHPELELTFKDGEVARHAPRADTFIDCTSNSSMGERKEMKVSGRQSAVFDFDLPGASGTVTKALFRLYAVDHYGKAGKFSLFELGGTATDLKRPLQSGIAAETQGGALSGHASVLFVEDFEEKDWRGNWSMFNDRSRAARTPSSEITPGRDGHAIKVTIRKGVNVGLDLRYRFGEELGAEPEEAYFRYDVMFPQEWETPIDGGKLPGLAGTYGRAGWGGRTPDGTNGWNMRMLFRRQAPSSHPGHGLVAVGSEMSIPTIPGKQKEDHVVWSLGQGGVLQKGRWYSIEQHVKLNTPGKADGEYRAWVDGRIAFERTGLVYRDVPDLKIEDIWMNVYHGGQAPPKKDLNLYIDNVIAAREYIGPLSNGASP